MEIWRDVPGYEGIYQVSNLGEIKSLERFDRRGYRKWPTRILRPARTRNGYLQVILAHDGATTKRYVHHIVTDAFLGPCPSGKERNHKNGDKADNSIGNLEYCTPSENHHHSYRVLGKKAAHGINSGHNKLTEEQVRFIRDNAKNITGKELAKTFNVSRSNVANIINRKAWKHI